MRSFMPTAPYRRAERTCRRVSPAVEGMEVRQTPTSTVLTSPIALIVLNPQPLPPESSPTTYGFQPCPSRFSTIY